MAAAIPQLAGSAAAALSRTAMFRSADSLKEDLPTMRPAGPVIGGAVDRYLPTLL